MKTNMAGKHTRKTWENLQQKEDGVLWVLMLLKQPWMPEAGRKWTR